MGRREARHRGTEGIALANSADSCLRARTSHLYHPEPQTFELGEQDVHNQSEGHHDGRRGRIPGHQRRPWPRTKAAPSASSAATCAATPRWNTPWARSAPAPWREPSPPWQSSGEPFTQGDHSLITCLFYAKSTAEGVSLEAPCTTTDGSGDRWYTLSHRHALATSQQVAVARAVWQLMGGTGKYAGVTGTCTYDSLVPDAGPGGDGGQSAPGIALSRTRTEAAVDRFRRADCARMAGGNGGWGCVVRLLGRGGWGRLPRHIQRGRAAGRSAHAKRKE